MAISEFASGSQACTVTTEHTLTAAAETTDGIYQVFMDFDAAVAGDAFEVKIKEKVVSAGTARIIKFDVVGDQVDTLWFSPSVILMHGWAVSLKQTTGTTRTIGWSVRSVA